MSFRPRGRIGDETVEIECIIKFDAPTKKAILIAPTVIGPDEVWIPRSQIMDKMDEGGGKWILHITEWFAKKEGLI